MYGNRYLYLAATWQNKPTFKIIRAKRVRNMSDEGERLVHPVPFESVSQLFGTLSDGEDCAGEEADLMDLTADETIDQVRWAQVIIRILKKDFTF